MAAHPEHRQALLPSIVVAAGDSETRASYVESTRMSDCEVIEAFDGRDALIKCLVRPPLLLVTDINLPHLDGASLCRILRRDRTTAQTPVVIVARDSQPEDVDSARDAGADVVLVKPVTILSMRREARGLLKRAETVRARSAEILEHASRLMGRSSALFERAAPALDCPSCQRRLTFLGARRIPEGTDGSEVAIYYVCAFCGTYAYSTRSKQLRRMD